MCEYARISLTVLFIPWDCVGRTGQDSGILGIFEDGTCKNPGDGHIHPMGLCGTGHWHFGDISEDESCENPINILSIPWDSGMGHWVLGIRMGGCMGIPGTVLPILQEDSTILKNPVQSHGT